MKKVLLFSLLFFLFIGKVSASTSSANSYILMDMTTDRVLSGRNYNTPYLIVSVTNIMTTCV